jgi:hypothetical protein
MQQNPVDSQVAKFTNAECIISQIHMSYGQNLTSNSSKAKTS